MNKSFYWILAANYSHSQLQASGEYVGLPDGQMGNSETGHLNIAAVDVILRTVFQKPTFVEKLFFGLYVRKLVKIYY